MAKNRYINTKFWSDAWVRKLNPLDRYLFLYLLANEHNNICGVYELPLQTMAFESGLDERNLKKSMLPRLKPKVIYYKSWVILPNFLKYQNQGSSKVQIGIKRFLSEVPRQIMKVAIEYGYPMGTLSHLNLNLNSNLNLNLKDMNLKVHNSKKMNYNEKNFSDHDEIQIDTEENSSVPVKQNKNKEWADFFVWWQKQVLNRGVKSYRAQAQDKILFHRRLKEFGHKKFTEIILFYLNADRFEKIVEQGEIPTIAAALSQYALTKYENR